MAGALRAVRSTDPATITLPDPDQVDVDQLPALVLQLTTLLARASARLLAWRPLPPDRLLDPDEASARLRTTPDWLLRQDRDRMPGVRVDLSYKQPRFSERGIDDWIAAERAKGSE